MPDFDNMMTNSVPAFLKAFGKEAPAIYTPAGLDPIPLTVILDPKTFAPSPYVGEKDIAISPQAFIETALLPRPARQKDKIEIDGTTYIVELPTEEHGMTTLQLREDT